MKIRSRNTISLTGSYHIKIAPTELHGETANLLAHYLTSYVLPRGLGRVGIEVGFHPPGDRDTALLPDVSFISSARMTRRALSSYVPLMPDLAVEVISPSQSRAQVRRKAEAYLLHGASLVWLIDPQAETAEVWRHDQPQRETIASDGELSGDDILPGFRLPLRQIFP